MGRALSEAFPAAKEVFQEVDDTLNYHLSRICMHGPEFDLSLTENTQPAIMACSIAALRVLERETGLDVAQQIAFVAGHSLGEYSALVAAESLTLAQAARLLKIRGQAMQKAVKVGDGAMAAILGLSLDVINDICEAISQKDAVCEVANYNSEQQIVISGHKRAVEQAMQQAKDKGAKRAVLLPVSAPFHCSLMQPAAERMAEALSDVTLRSANPPVMANVTAASVTDPADIKTLLVQQVTGMVRWQTSIESLMQEGVTRFIEVGHGKVLSGLIKRIAPDSVIMNIATPTDLDHYAAAA